VFGWSVKDTLFEQDTNEDLDLLDFGYSQTKWVAEQLILEAMRRGLQARIFRPALITPSVNGGGLNFDISIRLLAFMLKHGIGTTSQNQVSFSPADVVADNIVAISNESKSVGNTYHVTRDSYSNMGHITSILADLTSREFTDLTLADFVPEVIDKCGKDDLLFPLLSFFTRSITNITSMEFKRYDNSNYQQARSRVSAARKDPPLEDVVLGILRFMQRQGIAHGRT
jgi:thioester reductase-like protein